MNKSILYLGMDVHKAKIVVAGSKENGQANIIGEYDNQDKGIKRMLKEFAKLSKEYELRTCYEAGPCGYTIKRILDKNKITCDVIAPSLIPSKSGDRIKTDKKDACKLARYYRAGELTAIGVPEEEQEAVRDIVRCREDISQELVKIKQKTNHFLIRHGYGYSGKTNWSKKHITWIKSIKFEDEKLKYVLDKYINSIMIFELELKDITEKIEQIAETEKYRKKVETLRAYKGIKTITAMLIISEIVDFRRFSNPKELMSYLGLVPSEYSSGSKEHKGSITKCGNNRVRRTLVETGWHYAKNARITSRMTKQLRLIDESLREEPIKALHRLHKKYYHLHYGGKLKQKAVVAVARELIGFIWSSMIKVEEGNLEKERLRLAS